MPKKKPLVGPPKRLSSASQAQLRASERRLADLKSGRAGSAPPKAKPKAPAKNLRGAASLLRDAAKR